MLQSKLSRPLPPRVQNVFSFPSRRMRAAAPTCECEARSKREHDAPASDFVARVQCDCISGLKFVLGVEPRGAQTHT